MVENKGLNDHKKSKSVCICVYLYIHLRMNICIYIIYIYVCVHTFNSIKSLSNNCPTCARHSEEDLRFL